MQIANNRRMKTFLLLLLTSLAVAVLWQPVFARSRPTLNMSVIEAAKKEKKLVVYTTADLPQVLKIASQFVRKYPFIQLELFPATDAALLKKIHNNARAGMPSWDVLSGDGSVLRPLLEQNMVAPYRSPQRPAIMNGLIDGYGYWSGYYVNPSVLGYNTLAVKREDIPKNYEELLEPRWKGKQIAMDSEGHGLLSGWMRAWGMDKAIAYLQQLAKQKPRIAASSVATVQFVREGKSRLVIAHAPVIQAERRRGTAIDWLPLQPVIAEINAGCCRLRRRIPTARGFLSTLFCPMRVKAVSLAFNSSRFAKTQDRGRFHRSRGASGYLNGRTSAGISVKPARFIKRSWGYANGLSPRSSYL
jgi:iron(III) transport system substrate-binding protein